MRRICFCAGHGPYAGGLLAIRNEPAPSAFVTRHPEYPYAMPRLLHTNGRRHPVWYESVFNLDNELPTLIDYRVLGSRPVAVSCLSVALVVESLRLAVAIIRRWPGERRAPRAHMVNPFCKNGDPPYALAGRTTRWELAGARIGVIACILMVRKSRIVRKHPCWKADRETHMIARTPYNPSHSTSKAQQKHWPDALAQADLCRAQLV